MFKARSIVGFAAAGAMLAVIGCASPHQVAALREENQQLREQLQLETGRQMRDIVAAAITHFLDEHGRLPMRHSELRDVLGDAGWKNFIAPYDRTSETMDAAAAAGDPWAWVDEHGSFQWLPGEAFDHYSPVLVERGGLHQKRWVVFGDCHGEMLLQGDENWQRLGLPVMN